jgi:hypothetical protein
MINADEARSLSDPKRQACLKINDIFRDLRAEAEKGNNSYTVWVRSKISDLITEMLEANDFKVSACSRGKREVGLIVEW